MTQIEIEARAHRKPTILVGVRYTGFDFRERLDNGYFNPDEFRSLAATLPAQIALTFVIALGLPFVVYMALDRRGWDITMPVYLLIVLALVMTCVFIWVEGFLALRSVHPPREPSTPYPPASAIIAAARDLVSLLRRDYARFLHRLQEPDRARRPIERGDGRSGLEVTPRTA